MACRRQRRSKNIDMIVTLAGGELARAMKSSGAYKRAILFPAAKDGSKRNITAK